MATSTTSNNYITIDFYNPCEVKVKDMVDLMEPGQMKMYLNSLYPDTIMFLSEDDPKSPTLPPKLTRSKRTLCDFCSTYSYNTQTACYVNNQNIKKFSLCRYCYDTIEANVENRLYSNAMCNKAYLMEELRSR